MKQPSELESSYDHFDDARRDARVFTGRGIRHAKVIEREPYEFEYPTMRMYASASKAGRDR